MPEQPSRLRLNAMRVVFLLNFCYVGGFVLRAFIGHVGPWDPIKGVAYSFWGALALLSALGVRAPLLMMPVLLMQFVYKSVWLVAIYLPAGTDGGSGLLPVMLGGALVDTFVSPWPYVVSAFLKRHVSDWTPQTLSGSASRVR